MRPISPKTAVAGWSGALRAAEAIASATARSAPGSSIRTPPATLTKTSAWASGTPRVAGRARRRSSPGAWGRRRSRHAGASRGRSARRAPAPRAAAASSPRARRRPRSRPRRRPYGRRPRTGSGTRDEPGAGHLEDAQLVGRAEAVLGGAQDPVRVVALALELEHAVDEVLEHARTGDRAVLGHVPDEQHGDAVLLADPEQARGRLAHLSDRAGRGADVARPEGLHRVDHADVGPLALERRADRLERGLREDLDPAAPPSRSARSFTCAADSSPVTSSARRSREIDASAISSRVDLPTPGSPPTRTSDAGTMPAAQDPVELGQAGGDARRPPRSRLRRGGAASGRFRSSRGQPAPGRKRFLDERPERAAARALAEPARGGLTALGARELDGRLRHRAILGTRSDGACVSSVPSFVQADFSQWS